MLRGWQTIFLAHKSVSYVWLLTSHLCDWNALTPTRCESAHQICQRRWSSQAHTFYSHTTQCSLSISRTALWLWWSCASSDVWAGLHNNVPANLLPRWHKVHQSRAIQPRCTDVPDWVTNFCHATHLLGYWQFSFLSRAMVASWHPTGATLGEGRSGTLSCNPGLGSGSNLTADCHFHSMSHASCTPIG